MRVSARAKGVCGKMTNSGSADRSARATEIRETAESTRDFLQRRSTRNKDSHLLSHRSTSSQRVHKAELPDPRLSDSDESSEEAAGAELLRSHIQTALDQWGPVAALDCIIAAAWQLERPGSGVSHTKVSRLLDVLSQALDNVDDLLQCCWHRGVAPGSELTVAWDIVPAGPAELRICKGDRIKVLKPDGPGWECRSHNTDMSGWVPHSALALATPVEQTTIAL